MKVYQGSHENLKITLVLNGKCPKYGVDNVGTTPAALATYLMINDFNPDLVVNAGTCGGFAKQGGLIGDVYCCSGYKHHDRRIPLPGTWPEYGVGNHESTPSPNLIKFLGCKTGVSSTSNSLDHCDADVKLMTENDACTKDMEAAAKEEEAKEVVAEATAETPAKKPKEEAPAAEASAEETKEKEA